MVFIDSPYLFRRSLEIRGLRPLGHLVIVRYGQTDREHQVQVLHSAVEIPPRLIILIIRLVIAVDFRFRLMTGLVHIVATPTDQDGRYALLHEIEVVRTEIGTGRIFRTYFDYSPPGERHHQS